MLAYVQPYKSPIGILYIVSEDKKICGVLFKEQWKIFQRHFDEVEEKETPLIKRAKQELEEYFSGERKQFTLPLELKGTDFQVRVWSSLSDIPYGETRSYKDQAIQIRSPKASRAIGRAHGLNPLCVILPCHRIIGSNGGLTGYAGGIKAKKYLLRLEGNKKFMSKGQS